jgi:hypothetical protein
MSYAINLQCQIPSLNRPLSGTFLEALLKVKAPLRFWGVNMALMSAGVQKS